MSIIVEATYEGGVFKPKRPPNLSEGAEVRLEIVPVAPAPAEPDGDEPFVDPLAGLIGICKSGPEISLAARHDEILYNLRPDEPDAS